MNMHCHSGPRVERLNMGAYQALGLTKLSPIFHSRPEAEKWLRRELAKLPEAHRPRLRPCMCCAREFSSDGPHNRLCDPCRKRGQDVDPSVHSVVRGSRGQRRAK